jgi:hypothetical protein
MSERIIEDEVQHAQVGIGRYDGGDEFVVSDDEEEEEERRVEFPGSRVRVVKSIEIARNTRVKMRMIWTCI